MRVLLEIGYSKIMLPVTDDTGRLLRLLEGACIVEQKGYGEERMYTANADCDIQLTIVPDHQVQIEASQRQDVKLLALEKATKETMDANMARWKAEGDLAKFKEKIKALGLAHVIEDESAPKEA